MTPRISIITSLYRCHQYLEDFFHAVEEVDNKDQYEFLLLHNKPSKKEIEVIKKRIKEKPYYRHILIPELESLYASWNRGIRLAKADYLANWNVDDCRTPTSLLEQAVILDKNPKAAMTYGEQIAVENIGDKFGKLQTTPEYNTKTEKEFRKSTFIGCFQMWRKSIHNVVGYYDEQFRLVSDFEFQVRVAYNYPLVKTNKLIGYYLSGGTDRLSQNRMIQNEERTAVLLRYGIYYKMNLMYCVRSFRYKVFKINEFGTLVNYEEYTPNAKYNWIKNSYQILWALVFHLPFDFIQFYKIKFFPNLVIKRNG